MRIPAEEKHRLAELLSGARRHNTTGDAIALAVAFPAMRHWFHTGRSDILAWLGTSAPAETLSVLEDARRWAESNTDYDCPETADPYLCEKLLALEPGKQRRQRGVYYTPRALADFLVRRADFAMVNDFGLSGGLADLTAWQELLERGTLAAVPEHIDPTTSFVAVLDPALGSGIFLTAVIRRVYERTVAAGQAFLWSNRVLPALLPRLLGWELMLPALVAAVIQLATVLAETGFDFRQAIAIPWRQRDALAVHNAPPVATVLLGNPPYASLSTAKHGWIESLISDPAEGYTTIHGEPLGERKHWLHDDYVKFVRLAQWQVQRLDCGVVGLVTNHGYLENVSFRGMRNSLLKTFSRVEIVDLHGNAKNQRGLANGKRDENVFGIAAGIALNLFSRSPQALHAAPQLKHQELTGATEAKLACLQSDQLGAVSVLLPTAPLYLFVPNRAGVPHDYAHSPSLCEVMPYRASAPVTARDHFTVAFTKEELLRRLHEFRDLSIPDDAIRARWFQRTRSPNYPPGDTRSWKLGAARQQFAADEQWAKSIRLVQYRPLDQRWIAWHPALIDWPRAEFARHMLAGPNVALIARRQSPAHQPACFFWATSTLALDGIIRSDNRGNESFFPVWLYDEAGHATPNFAASWIAQMEQITQQTLAPQTLAAYIYGCFFSLAYREQNQIGIVHDFPRIPLPCNAEAFADLSQLGEKLLRLHTACDDAPLAPLPIGIANLTVARGYPVRRAGQVWINAETPVAEIEQDVWELSIGAHQVARKWLKDRVGCTLSENDVRRYGRVVRILTATQALMPQRN